MNRSDSQLPRAESDLAQPIRVLQLGSPIGLYGAERWILALVKHLDRSQVLSHVGVILDDPAQAEADLCRSAAEFGLPVVHFRAPGRLSRAAVGQLREYIKEHGIDVLHTHGYKTDLLGLLAVRGTACRILATPHGWSTAAGVKLQIYEGLDRLAFYAMDRVAPLSPKLHDELARWPGLGRKLSTVLNGVDVSEVDHAEPYEEEGAGAARPFIIGYVGQLIDRKRLDTLIRAFAELDDPGCHLWLVGEGEERQRLERLADESGAADRVRFFGFRNDRLALLKRFDLFVLPSSLEGIPRCVMESMAAGVPVVASDIPGCTDIVHDGDTGLTFECGNVDELCEALRRCRQDQTLRARLAGAARRLIDDRYSASIMARRYTELYRDLLIGGES